MSDPLPCRGRHAALGALGAAVLTFLLLQTTSPSLAIVWDEGFTLGRIERVRLWFQSLGDPAGFAARYQPPTPLERLVQQGDELPPRPDQMDTRAELFQDPALRWFWPFARAEPHGHPPFYALIGLIGDFVVPGWDPLARARFGPMLVFSMAGGLLFAFLASGWGVVAGLAGAGAWALQPRLFAHAHYAHYDGLLTSVWMLAILAFAHAVAPPPPESSAGRFRPRWGWVLAFGALCGCAAGIKLTGWFLAIPFLAWTALYRDRRGLVTLLAGAVVAALVVYAITPLWWADPIGGVEEFFRSNLTRSKTTRIPILFLGRLYMTPRESLPWYNTLAWTALVTPLGILGLAMGGIVRAIRRARSEPFGMLVLAQWGFLMALRSLPGAPGHDGIRQFLAAFGCLALLAGLGAAEALERRPRLGRIFTGAALVEGLISIAVMMPVPLSYFAPQAGFLPGAVKLGMEPTYYWDALDGATRQWLDRETPPGQSVMFATNPTAWLYLRQTGQLTAPISAIDRASGPPAWYVVQNRTGMLSPVDQRLIARLGPACTRVSKLGVPLIWAFPFAEFEREMEAMKAEAPRP